MRRFAAALAVAAAGTLAAFAPSGSANFPGANGRILFHSDRDGNYEIYSVNPDGSDPVRLTTNPGSDGTPVLSPDGTQIAFTSERDGGPEIYVMNADGSGVRRLTNNALTDVWPVWSPDGTKIAFSSAASGVEYDLFVVNADGTGLRQLTSDPGLDWMPSWSPDGSRIVFAATRGDVSTLIVMGADGSNQVHLTPDEAVEIFPDWSPDGRRIAYTRNVSGDDEIHVMNADGSGDANISNNPAPDDQPSWSPDGTRIVFESLRAGDSELFTMNPDGSGIAQVTSSPGIDSGADWGRPPAPPPKLGETVNVSVVSGTVKVKTSGQAGFRVLSQAAQIKVGSELDTTKGVVRLASAAGKGKTQSGDFGRGVFAVTQSKAGKGLTDLKLKGGRFSSCKGSAEKGSAAAKKKTIRRLFGKAKGKFRTKGRYSAASVRGTTWTVSDRCDGTLTSVTSGTVSVFDFKRKKTVKVKAGKSYLARAKR